MPELEFRVREPSYKETMDREWWVGLSYRLSKHRDNDRGVPITRRRGGGVPLLVAFPYESLAYLHVKYPGGRWETEGLDGS